MTVKADRGALRGNIGAETLAAIDGTYRVPPVAPSAMADYDKGDAWESPRNSQVGGDHYSKYKFQPFDIADEYDLSRRLTVAMKYVLRNKGDTVKKIHDLRKAKHCIDLEIERLEAL